MLDGGIISTSIFAVVVFLITYLYLKLRRPPGFPPGPPAVPVLGSFPFMNVAEDGNIFPELTRLSNKYGPVYSIAIGHSWVVVLNDYRTIKEAMINQGVDFAGRPLSGTLRAANPMFPALGVVDDTYTEQWKLQRHTALQVLRSLGEGRRSVIEDCILEESEMLIEAFKGCQGDPIDVQHHASCAVLNVLLSILFGDRYDYSDPDFAALRRHLDNAFEATEKVMGAEHIPGVWLLPSHRHNLQAMKETFGIVNAFIQKKIDENVYDESVDRARNFVEGYQIERQKNAMVENRVFQNISDFLQAGLETMTTTLGWALYFMVAYPRVQKLAQEELDAVVGRGRPPRLSDRERLPYIEATLLEVLRLATTAPSSIPHETIRDTSVGGFQLPRGTQVWVNIWAVMRNADLWPEPTVFRPERFLGADGKVVCQEQLIPFGLGRRSCLGEDLARQELFLFVTNLLHAFDLRQVEGESLPPPSGNLTVTHRPPDFRFRAQQRP